MFRILYTTHRMLQQIFPRKLDVQKISKRWAKLDSCTNVTCSWKLFFWTMLKAYVMKWNNKCLKKEHFGIKLRASFTASNLLYSHFIQPICHSNVQKSHTQIIIRLKQSRLVLKTHVLENSSWWKLSLCTAEPHMVFIFFPCQFHLYARCFNPNREWDI